MDQIEKIEQFLKNQLDAEDKIIFENEIESSLELKREVNIHKQLLLGMQGLAIENLLIQAGERYDVKKVRKLDLEPTLKLLSNRWLAAAGILIFFSFGVFYKKQLYISSETKEIVSLEMQKKSIPLNFPKGATNDQKNTMIQQKVQYYLVLTFIQKGQKQKAKRILNRIITNRNHKFYNQSINILNNL